jgi:hypothetical protein
MRKIRGVSRIVGGDTARNSKNKAYSNGSDYALTTYGMGSISGGIAFCIGTSAHIAQEADNASKRNVKKRPMVNRQAKS